MSSYKKYPPVGEAEDITTVMSIYKERQDEYRKRKLNNLKELAPIKCLPSYLVRTFQDYVANREDLAQFERYVIGAWERAGLDQGKAKAVLERLYSVGPEIYDHLDKAMLYWPVKSLDGKLVKDFKEVQWTEFLKDGIDPQRIRSAFSTGQVADLSQREKDFIECHVSTYKMGQDGTQIAAVAEKTQWLMEPTTGKYIFSEEYKAAKVFNNLTEVAHYVDSLAGETPAPPEKKVCSYYWKVNQLGHKIDSFAEATGDDPVFIVNVFKRVDSVPGLENLLASSHVLKPKANEKHKDFRPNFEELYDPKSEYLGTERPVVVVSAFEDDQYFSNDTKAYIEFGLEVADRLSSFDPTGYGSIGVAILQIAWSVVKFVDWLDDDDFIGTVSYEFIPSMIPDGTGDGNLFSKQVDMKVSNGKSSWRYRIEFVSRGVVYITQ
jgi:hypothetical protein